LISLVAIVLDNFADFLLWFNLLVPQSNFYFFWQYSENIMTIISKFIYIFILAITPVSNTQPPQQISISPAADILVDSASSQSGAKSLLNFLWYINHFSHRCNSSSSSSVYCVFLTTIIFFIQFTATCWNACKWCARFFAWNFQGTAILRSRSTATSFRLWWTSDLFTCLWTYRNVFRSISEVYSRVLEIVDAQNYKYWEYEQLTSDEVFSFPPSTTFSILRWMVGAVSGEKSDELNDYKNIEKSKPSSQTDSKSSRQSNLSQSSKQSMRSRSSEWSQNRV